MIYRSIYLLVIIFIVATSGCTVPKEVTMAPNLKMPAREAPKVPRRHLKRLPGELDKGTAKHALAVNGVQLIMTYFTRDDPLSWGPTSQGAVNVSSQVQGIHSKKIARITHFRIIAPPTKEKGQDTILVNDGGQFVIGAPYSYGSAFNFPSYPKDTKQIQVRVHVDLEIETKPHSGQYTRQSLIDSLRVTTVPIPLSERTK